MRTTTTTRQPACFGKAFGLAALVVCVVRVVRIAS